MISRELLIDRMNSHNLPTQELTVKVDGVFYQVCSKRRELIMSFQENLDTIIPKRYRLFYLSDTTYSLPTQQYSFSFVVK